MQHGREPDGKKDADRETYAGDDEEDGCGFGGPSSTNLGLHDAIDDRHQDGGKKRASVDQRQLFRQQIDKAEAQQKGEGEEDVAANNAP